MEKNIGNFFCLFWLILSLFSCSEDDSGDGPKKNYSFEWGETQLLSTEAHEAAITSQINDCISVSGKYVYTVWASAQSMEQGNVCFCRSDDFGTNWNAPVILEYSNYSVGGVAIDSDSSNVHIVWKEVYDSPEGVLYIISSQDYGTTWSGKQQISKEEVARSSAPNILAGGNQVYVSWENYAVINGREKCNVCFRKSDDCGNTWSSIMDISEENEGGPYLTLGANGGLNLVYVSNNYDIQETNRYNWEIMYKNSTNQGLSWDSDPLRLTSDFADSRFPTAAAEENHIHIVWWDDMNDTIYEHYGYPPIFPEEDHNYEIYYLRSSDNGLSWGLPIRLTFADGVSSDPSVQVKNGIVGVVYGDYRNEKDAIYYIYSDDNGTSWQSETLIDQTSQAKNPSLDMDDQGNVYIAWSAKSNNQLNIFFRKGNCK